MRHTSCELLPFTLAVVILKDTFFVKNDPCMSLHAMQCTLSYIVQIQSDKNCKGTSVTSLITDTFFSPSLKFVL
jgi:hypothetical protein